MLISINTVEHSILGRTINEIGYENILQILPIYCGQGQFAYTIIYKEKGATQ